MLEEESELRVLPFVVWFPVIESYRGFFSCFFFFLPGSETNLFIFLCIFVSPPAVMGRVKIVECVLVV